MNDNPKQTTWLENGKTSLLRMRQEIQLSESELAAVERGINSLDLLLAEFSGPAAALNHPITAPFKTA